MDDDKHRSVEIHGVNTVIHNNHNNMIFELNDPTF